MFHNLPIDGSRWNRVARSECRPLPSNRETKFLRERLNFRGKRFETEANATIPLKITMAEVCYRFAMACNFVLRCIPKILSILMAALQSHFSLRRGAGKKRGRKSGREKEREKGGEKGGEKRGERPGLDKTAGIPLNFTRKRERRYGISRP